MTTKDDFYKGFLTGVAMATSTNFCYYGLWCNNHGHSFRWIPGIYIGYISNLKAFTASITITQICGGIFKRFAEKHQWELNTQREVGIWALAGMISSFGVVRGENEAVGKYLLQKFNVNASGKQMNLTMYCKVGFNGLFAGLKGSMLRDSIIMGSVFSSSRIKQKLKEMDLNSEPLSTFSASMISGGVAVVITNEFQKMRINAQENAWKMAYQLDTKNMSPVTFFQVIKKTWHQNGLKGFGQGMPWRFTALSIMSCCKILIDKIQ